MKRCLTFLVFFMILFGMSLSISMTANAENGDVVIDAANFPDENFRDYVSKFDTDGNGALDELEISSVESISVTGCSSLTGIEYFTSLTSLSCRNSQMTSLDVSHNTKLKVLYCYNNQLTALDVSSNTALEELSCYKNQLTSLNLNNTASLKELRCQNNNLESLDLSGCPALEGLFCPYNKLTSLDVSSNPSLRDIYCNNNQLTELDVSDHASLNQLLCNANQLTVLNLSNTPALKSLSCEDNKLSSLDVSERTSFDYLTCENNQLTVLNITNVPALSYLSCNNNQLTDLDMSNKPALTSLYCYNNQLTALDMSDLPVLYSLNCANNRLTALDVSNTSGLEYLDCSMNQLTALDLRDNTQLVILICYGNHISALDIIECATLVDAYNNGVKTEEMAGGLTYLLYEIEWGESLAVDVDTIVITDAQMLPLITAQPESVAASAGTRVSFEVTAVGTDLTYQWQYSADGNTWKKSNATGADTNSISLYAAAAKNGYLYRCIIKDANGNEVTSLAAELVIKASITAQPKSVSAAIGTRVSFKVTAAGTGLTYQWQYSTDGNTWKKSNATGAKTDSISLSVTEAKNGYQYHCIITDTYGNEVTSSAAVLTVKTAVTAQPESVTAAAGTRVSFEVTASGAGLTYQWQYSPDGNTWKKSNATGTKTNSISLKATASKNGYQYRCVITDVNGKKLTTSAAKLTVE